MLRRSVWCLVERKLRAPLSRGAVAVPGTRRAVMMKTAAKTHVSDSSPPWRQPPSTPLVTSTETHRERGVRHESPRTFTAPAHDVTHGGVMHGAQDSAMNAQDEDILYDGEDEEEMPTEQLSGDDVDRRSVVAQRTAHASGHTTSTAALDDGGSGATHTDPTPDTTAPPHTMSSTTTVPTHEPADTAHTSATHDAPATETSTPGSSSEAYRFLLQHIDAEIASLQRRQQAVSARRQKLEERLTHRVRELFTLMESPWLLLPTDLSPPLPATGVDVFVKEQQLLRRQRQPPGTTMVGEGNEKLLVLACHKNYRGLPASEKRVYDAAAAHNATLRQELKRRLSLGCARFEEYCAQVKECTAAMVRDGVVPVATPASAAAPRRAVTAAVRTSTRRVAEGAHRRTDDAVVERADAKVRGRPAKAVRAAPRGRAGRTRSSTPKGSTRSASIPLPRYELRHKRTPNTSSSKPGKPSKPSRPARARGANAGGTSKPRTTPRATRRGGK